MLVTLRGQTINKRTVVLYWNDEDDEKHSNVQLNSLLVHPIRFFLTDSNQYLPLPYSYVDLARILLIVATICLLKSFSIRAFYSVICIMSRMVCENGISQRLFRFMADRHFPSDQENCYVKFALFDSRNNFLSQSRWRKVIIRPACMRLRVKPHNKISNRIQCHKWWRLKFYIWRTFHDFRLTKFGFDKSWARDSISGWQKPYLMLSLV